MNLTLFEELHRKGLISDASFEKLKDHAAQKLFSVHWELKIILYLGVLLLSSGLGVLIYKNIDTIGHQAILVFIALVCTGCFYYCFKNKLPFSHQRVSTPNPYFDYILLLGCLTFVSFVTYLQFQYNVFGNRYGLAAFFPMVVLFFSAYFFDHLGILSMAITNLAAWAGITITPAHILRSNDFNSDRIIYTGLALGVLLVLAAWLSRLKNIKQHFELTYNNFGTHLLFIACLSGLFTIGNLYLLWFLLLAVMAFYFYTSAVKNKSFYFVVITTLYFYVGISYVFIRLLEKMGSLDIGAVYIGFIYFIASGIGLVLFLISVNRKLKAA